jgi:hypothetical protein
MLVIQRLIAARRTLGTIEPQPLIDLSVAMSMYAV